MLALRLKLNSSRIAIFQATYEINLRGDFPQEAYLELFRTQMHLLQALGSVGHSLMRLDRTWRKRLVSTTAFLNQPLVRFPFASTLEGLFTDMRILYIDC